MSDVAVKQKMIQSECQQLEAKSEHMGHSFYSLEGTCDLHHQHVNQLPAEVVPHHTKTLFLKVKLQLTFSD